MRYYITVHNEGGQFNATAKAPADVSAILKREGWHEVIIKRKQNKNIIVYRFSCLFEALKLVLRFRPEDELLIQLPQNKYIAFWLKYSLFRHPKVSVLIHDLDELRNENTKTDYSLMKQAYKVIAHTETMKDYLIKKGVLSNQIYVLHFFDYIALKKRITASQYGNSVTFAGNLMKSNFIKKLKDIDGLKEIEFFLYGASCPDGIVGGSNIHYMGKFSPDDISIIEGDWGLVWDGDDIETCSSTSGANVGNYLRYNASHKISLYLAAGMPLIVWKDSGIANYVEKNNLGVTISSLNEIPKAISSAQSRVYLIKKAVEVFSKKVRNGEMLKEAMDGC